MNNPLLREITSLNQLVINLTNDNELFADKALVSEYFRGKYNRNQEIIAFIKNTEPDLIEEVYVRSR